MKLKTLFGGLLFAAALAASTPASAQLGNILHKAKEAAELQNTDDSRPSRKKCTFFHRPRLKLRA